VTNTRKVWRLTATRGILLCQAVIGPVLLSGCDLPGKPNPEQKFVFPSEVKDFTTLYKKNCAGCHGKEGKLGPAPPLNDAVFLAIVPQKALEKVIGAGRPGTEMPAFAQDQGGTLTDEQVQTLATGLRKHVKWTDPSVAKKQWPSYLLPAEKGNKDRGLIVFARACADCHGEDGRGKTAINDPTFLDLASEQMLRRIVITGRNDLGMPNCAEGDGRPLTEPEINDLVALMMSWKK
jgi:cytochrome c oxidase cbb3-type subunit III